MKRDLPLEQVAAVAHRHYTRVIVATTGQTEFPLPTSVAREDDVRVYVDGLRKRLADVSGNNDFRVRGFRPDVYAGDKNMIKFTAAPGNGKVVTIDVVGG